MTEIEPTRSVPGDPALEEAPARAASDAAPALPPDPVAYDSPRAVRARQKGLQAPYIAGGNDPDPATGLAEDRRYVRLLLAMAIAIVASGFIIGIAIALIGPAGGTR